MAIGSDVTATVQLIPTCHTHLLPFANLTVLDRTVNINDRMKVQTNSGNVQQIRFNKPNRLLVASVRQNRPPEGFRKEADLL